MGEELEKEEGGKKGDWMYVSSGMRENSSTCGYKLKEPLLSGVHEDWLVQAFLCNWDLVLKKSLEPLEVTVHKILNDKIYNSHLIYLQMSKACK